MPRNENFKARIMRRIFKFNFPRKNETPYRKILFRIPDPISRIKLHVTRVITPSSIVEHSLSDTLSGVNMRCNHSVIIVNL